MYPVYAWKTVEDTPFMRKWIPRLCVENTQDSRLDVDSARELLHLFCRASAELSAARPLRPI